MGHVWDPGKFETRDEFSSNTSYSVGAGGYNVFLTNEKALPSLRAGVVNEPSLNHSGFAGHASANGL